jgi:hypothetical protein
MGPELGQRADGGGPGEKGFYFIQSVNGFPVVAKLCRDTVENNGVWVVGHGQPFGVVKSSSWAGSATCRLSKRIAHSSKVGANRRWASLGEAANASAAKRQAPAVKSRPAARFVTERPP